MYGRSSRASQRLYSRREENMVKDTMQFQEITTEARRIYRLANDGVYVIEGPRRLYVAASGSHRVESADGRLHYVAAGFQAITIELLPNEKGFSF